MPTPNTHHASTQTTLSPEQYLSLPARQKLRAHAKAEAYRLDSRRAWTDHLIVEIMLGSGLRSQEVCDLTLADLPWTHRTFVLYVRCGKKGKARTVDLNSRVAGLICRYIRRFRPGAGNSEPLFVGCHGTKLRYHVLYDKIRRLGLQVGLQIHPHMLRHSFAVWLYSIEHDILNVQKQLGHSNLDDTMIYARTDSEASRRQAAAMQ